MIRISHPLCWWVKKLACGERFSLARYGDGELACMFGRQGSNCDGVRYTLDLKMGLLNSLHVSEQNFYHGLQTVLPEDADDLSNLTRAIGVSPPWYNSEVFSDALVEGELYPLISQLRQMKTVIVSNARICLGVKSLLGGEQIEIGPVVCTSCQITTVVETIQKTNAVLRQTSQAPVYILCCGLAANVIASTLHGIDGWLLDLGSLFDPFCGIRTRSHHAAMTEAQVRRNLEP